MNTNQLQTNNLASLLPLRAFLCHSSGDKSAVRNLYQRLKADGFDPWLDEEKLLPGQDWHFEIRRAVKTSHVVLVCLSQASISKIGFVNREIKYALDVADEQPEGAIFILPVKLERRSRNGKDEIDRKSWGWLAQEKSVGGRACNQRSGSPQ